MTPGKVSILILNYNGRQYLKDCLDSVLAQVYPEFEIILFDNASSDGSVDFIKSHYDDNRIKIITSDINLGFAGGNNAAYCHAEGEYIVLLNNDTVTENGWLVELVAALNKDARTGMAQSLVITEGIPLKYYKRNGTVNLLGHNIMEVFDIGEDGTGEIFLAGGCSLIIRKELADRLGGLFPEEYFAYSEDTYLSFKVKFAGYKIVHTSSSVVRHKGGATTKKYRNSFITFYQERNRILNFLIFFSAGFRIKYIFLLLLNLKLKILYSLFSGKYSVAGIIKAYFWICSHGKWIRKKRKELDAYKTTGEKEVLKMLSGRYANGNNLWEKYINFITLAYLKIVNIKTIESD